MGRAAAAGGFGARRQPDLALPVLLRSGLAAAAHLAEAHPKLSPFMRTVLLLMAEMARGKVRPGTMQEPASSRAQRRRQRPPANQRASGQPRRRRRSRDASGASPCWHLAPHPRRPPPPPAPTLAPAPRTPPGPPTSTCCPTAPTASWRGSPQSGARARGRLVDTASLRSGRPAATAPLQAGCAPLTARAPRRPALPSQPPAGGHQHRGQGQKPRGDLCGGHRAHPRRVPRPVAGGGRRVHDLPPRRGDGADAGVPHESGELGDGRRAGG
jgi:hypothetical protein